MLKKCTILGLALLVVGGLAFIWVRKQARAEQSEASAPAGGYSLQSDEVLEKYDRWYLLSPEEQNQLALELDKDHQSKTQEEVNAEQRARLRAHLARLAAGEMNPGDIADFLYGPNWQDKVVQYQKRREQEQIGQTAAIVCLAIGSVLTGACIVLWMLCSIARGFKALKRQRSKRRQSVDSEPSELTDIPHEEAEEDASDDDELAPPTTGTVTDQPAFVTDAPPLKNGEDEEFKRFIVPRSHPEIPAARASLASQPRTEDSSVALLLCDEPASETEWSAQSEWSTAEPQADPAEVPPQRQRFTPRPKVMVLGEESASFPETSTVAEESAAVVENPLQEQADDLQKQIAEFREMAQSVQQASREQSAPLSGTLKELAQQVSAIREYAACQQDRVEKLQDGYDWTIIRTFCLRVIRCIDNLENRMKTMAGENEAASHLEEVRDELLFALESSGIEQFRPEIDSDYRGQEKWAEAIREKEAGAESDQIGNIAKVIRPGYRYIIDEETYKVVRTAQVKLFG